ESSDILSLFCPLVSYLMFSNLSLFLFFFSSRRRHTRSKRDWSSDVCSSDLVVFGAPAVQMPRGGEKYCAFKDDWPDCKMAIEGTVCISEDGKCGNGVEIGRPGEGSGEDGNHSAPTN